MNYIGEKCAACGNVFTEDDDVVVCPDCGSPHHRECYKSAGKCANEDYHFSGKKWERKKLNVPEFVKCPVCGFPNYKGEEKCVRCGNALVEKSGSESADTEEENLQEPFSGLFDEEFVEAKPYLGFDPDEDLGGATIKEVSDFVKTNTIYYLPVFKKMKDFGSKLSFNVTCLFPSLFFANRKMWGWAILAVFLSVIFAIPEALIYMVESSALPEQSSLYHLVESNMALFEKLGIICNAADFVVRLLFCFFGNRIYFKYIVRSLKKIKNDGGNFMAQKLASMGGINPTNMIVITLIKAGVALGITMLGIYLFEMLNLIAALP